MDPFVRDLLTSPALDAADERSLALRARSGDVGARERLIVAGMRSVVLRAMSRGLRGEELRDAVQAGAVGLILAVDRFDPDRGARLATYAWHWIGAAMTTPRTPEICVEEVPGVRSGDDHADDQTAGDPLTGLPGEWAEVLRLRHGLAGSLDGPMPRRAVAERLGLTVAQVRDRETKAMRQVRAGLAKVVHRAPPRGAGPL